MHIVEEDFQERGARNQTLQTYVNGFYYQDSAWRIQNLHLIIHNQHSKFAAQSKKAYDLIVQAICKFERNYQRRHPFPEEKHFRRFQRIVQEGDLVLDDVKDIIWRLEQEIRDTKEALNYSVDQSEDPFEVCTTVPFFSFSFSSNQDYEFGLEHSVKFQVKNEKFAKFIKDQVVHRKQCLEGYFRRLKIPVSDLDIGQDPELF